MGFSISEAKSLFSSVLELYKKGSNLEAEQKLQEIQEAFIDLKAENIELKEELHELKKKTRIQENLKYEAPFYYLENENAKDGPFCQRCYDAEDKLVRLVEKDSTKGSHICKECKNYYGDGRPLKF